MASTLLRRRGFMALAGASVLSGCGARGQFSTAMASDAAAGTRTLLVATARAADPSPIAYGPGRADALGFARLTISIPPTHVVGEIEWAPGGTGVETDPSRHFALVGAEPLQGIDAFAHAARGVNAARREEAVLFVHGYNTNFAEGVYRHAQIAWDYDLRGPQIHFAWPSAAEPFGYAYDRDSTLIARDHLARLILHLTREPDVRLSIVGHSMGAFLVMEALRQIALQSSGDPFENLAGVTLISPDIDIDLFRVQARALEDLPQPFVIAVSQNDRLLRLSSRLAGGQTRLGTLEDLAQLEGLGIYVVDMTGLEENGANHFLPGTSATAIAAIRGLQGSSGPQAENITLGPVRISLGSAL
ncbi:alpha/beta hydrolase [Tritonibacter mobilis]|uniref:alpha/beta hydrolase n=1 Tax=Tritonibacter mobilis TaxID=379347 RepID=UPI000E0DD191|nr:alpha/beta fold hydrolase [Tritonibacter mobilis]